MSPDTPNVLEAIVHLEQTRTRAIDVNKFVLDLEKEKDDAEQEVQRLQQVLQVKKVWTHTTTVKDHKECDKKPSDDMDLPDHRRERNGPLKRMHTGDLGITGCVSLVMQVMSQVVWSRIQWMMTRNSGHDVSE